MKKMNPAKRKDYPKEAYRYLFEVEDKHFWFTGRNEVIRQTIEHTSGAFKNQRFLEVGCGTGYVLRMLEAMGFAVTGLDMWAAGLKFARRRTKAKLIQGDLAQLNKHISFDMVGAFDVVEHTSEDVPFVQACWKILRPGGKLYISVPAGSELWSDFDIMSGHKRRYSKESLVSLLKRAGFRVIFVNYFGFFQYLPYLVTKKFIFWKGRSNKNSFASIREFLRPPILPINWVLRKCFFLESRMMQVIEFPFGTSLMAVAVKVL